MTIPRITSLLIMLALGRDVVALQLGQISSQSWRGQPLSARITLYGAAPIQSDAVVVEIMAEFGAAEDSLSKLGVRAQLKSDDSGAHYIALTSSSAIEQAQLALRVRLREGSRALLRRYSLALVSAPAPRPVRATTSSRSASVAPAVARAPGGNYGPVRPGQSLWRILQELGLARGDTSRLMRAIVDSNPSAFVGGDATRLRVGAMLRLPATTGGAKATPATAALRTRDNTPVDDPALKARLDRLGREFALIRARYAEQKSRVVTETSVLTRTTVQSPSGVTPTTEATSAPALTIAQRTPVAKAQSQSPPSASAISKSKAGTPPSSNIINAGSATRSNYAEGKTLLLLGVCALGVALITLALQLARRQRGKRADAGARSADRDLVAEIARKAEKRVQLEGEIKRMIAGRRVAAEDSMSGGLRPADLLGGGHTSLDEIESHIAHGRYGTAESMLEQVIAAGPNNHRAKLRLAEIYYLNERNEEFVLLSEEIHRRHRGEIGDENWARLMRMGKIIAPGRPPFSGPLAVEFERQAG
jgi:pilus assembly protein FimV